MIVLMQRMLPAGVEVGEMRGEPLLASELIFAANCCHRLFGTAEGAVAQLIFICDLNVCENFTLDNSVRYSNLIVVNIVCKIIHIKIGE